MKKEEKVKFNEKLNNYNHLIQSEEEKAIKSKEYQLIESAITELKADKRDSNLKYTEIKRNIYEKYVYGNYGYGMGIKLDDIRSSVKQGIKRGLGAKNIKSIENYIVNIVKELINRELRTPYIKELHNNLLKSSKEISELRDKGYDLVEEKIKDIKEKRRKFLEKSEREKILKDKKLDKQKREVDKKVENLSSYFPQIIKEVNKRLILDGIEK